MNTRAKTALLAFTLISLLAAPFADAGRLGGGRSYGMRRAAPTAPAYTPPTQQAIPQPQAQPQRSGPGIGTAIGAGVAGAAAGYMLGSAMNRPEAAPASAPARAAPPPAPAAAGPNVPWNLLIILGVIFVVGLVWFRRRIGMPDGAPSAANQGTRLQSNRTFDNQQFDPIPPIGSGFPGSGASQQTQSSNLRRLPDGTETPYFLRQAKATFQHLQSLNSPDAVDEVRRYMTAELFEELRGEILRNSETADFVQLDCQLLDASEENGRYLASVRYSGQVSETVNAVPQPFSETWHFVKETGNSSAKWMVAGIQQND